MKKITLSILSLAAVIGIIPSSLYPVEVTKDSVAIRMINEKSKSTIFKKHYLNLTCLYVRIKNDTDAPIEIPKHAISSAFIAKEKTFTKATNKISHMIRKSITDFFFPIAPNLILFTLSTCRLFSLLPYDYKHRIIMGLTTSALISFYICHKKINQIIETYHDQVKIKTMLQEHLDRKMTTIQIGGEIGFYIYVDLDQYQRSTSKNITIRLHKKDSDQAILCEVDTTELLPTQSA